MKNFIQLNIRMQEEYVQNKPSNKEITQFLTNLWFKSNLIGCHVTNASQKRVNANYEQLKQSIRLKYAERDGTHL